MPLKLLETRRTGWQNISVWGDADEVEFRVTGGAVHAWWARGRYLTGLAWDSITAGILSRGGSGPPKSLLMLGLGGGTSLRTLRFLCPGIRITAVEIDDGMIRLARDYMELDSLGIEVIAADAYAWLAKNRRKFDVVFDDVYGVSATDVERPMESPDTLLPDLLRSLKPGGTFASNLVTGPGHRRVQSGFRRFYQKHFPHTRSITTPDSLNECLIGSAAALRPWPGIRDLAKQFPTDADYSNWRLLRARPLPALG